jgi:hypothetical protein
MVDGHLTKMVTQLLVVKSVCVCVCVQMCVFTKARSTHRGRSGRMAVTLTVSVSMPPLAKCAARKSKCFIIAVLVVILICIDFFFEYM